jgi:hypothetical protein
LPWALKWHKHNGITSSKRKLTMTETTGGADSLVVADADDEGDETVPLAAAGAGIVPTPCQKGLI